MEVFVEVIKYIWFAVLVLSMATAICLFIKHIRYGSKNIITVNSNTSSCSLNGKASEKTIIIKLICFYILWRALSIALVFFIKSIFVEGYTFSFAKMFSELTRWDGSHYIGLIQNGYVNLGDARFHIVFYPLFPWVSRIFYYIICNARAAAFITSNLCMCGAVGFGYKLLRMDLNVKDSVFGVLMMIVTPFAFFCSMPYTESLFMLLLILFFMALRKKRWLYAGICGFFAMLTKNFGLMLLVPYVVAFIFDAVKEGISLKRVLRTLSPILLIFAGFGCYLLLNKVITGDYFTFMLYQKEHWNNEISCILRNVTNQYRWFFISYANSPGIRYPIWLPAILTTIYVFVMYFITVKKVPQIYSLYTLACMFFTLMVSWPLSIGRYMMCTIPLYVMLPYAIKKDWARYIALGLCALTQILVFFVYSCGGNIM